MGKKGERLFKTASIVCDSSDASYNAKYVFPRHGLATSGDVSKSLETFLTKVTDQSTQ
jgi:hypothetical protein